MSITTLPLGGSAGRSCQGGAVTIGNFDGVHRGHQALLAEAARQAKLLTGPAVAVTFAPHPLQLLRPENFLPLLTTLDDRVALLQQYGADHVVVLETTQALLHLTPEQFFAQIIGNALGARAIVEGANFGFGKDKAGSVATLQALGRARNIGVFAVPALQLHDQPVSSSRVRNELLLGHVAVARAMLGRPFRMVGTVKPGQKRGQTLGFPTANLADVATLVPGDGVYAVRVSLEKQTWPGAANIGPNPTFGEKAHKVEVHLIGFQGDLYDRTLTVDFVERLRDTRPFAGVEELKAQLEADVARAKEIVA